MLLCYHRHVQSSACDPTLNTAAKMPAVSTGVKELYLSTSLGELNKKAEIKPEKTSTRRYRWLETPRRYSTQVQCCSRILTIKTMSKCLFEWVFCLLVTYTGLPIWLLYSKTGNKCPRKHTRDNGIGKRVKMDLRVLKMWWMYDCYSYLLYFSYVQSACKIFKAAEECRLDRDEEKAYVLYMKYLTVYDIIKKRADFKQQPVKLILV